MASLDQHRKDCLCWLCNEFEEVHKWLDEYFATHGSEHRKFRHHKEGIEEARRLFGDSAAAAASIHILRDCRNIPSEEDYVTGEVDPLGLRKTWPVAAYSSYTEEAFSALVKHKLHGPTGLILWAFMGDDAVDLLRIVTRLTPEEIQNLLGDLSRATKLKDTLPPLSPVGDSLEQITGDARRHFEKFRDQPLFSELVKQFGQVEFAYVPTDSLVTPLALIDYEFVEELRAEVQGDDPLSVARFAAPETVTLPMKLGVDPTTKSVTIVSPQKTLAVGGVEIRQIVNAGIEVVIKVTGAAMMVIASRVADTIYLRTGIHRAFLLASTGLPKIPCIVVRENQLTTVTSAYPAFNPILLSRPRPPLLIDFLNESLALSAPLQRTHRIIRITTEDFLVPVD